MVRKETARRGPVAQATPGDAKPPEVVGLLAKVEKSLSEGQPTVALEWIERARLSSPWLTNAVGVCQLRLGCASAAIDVYRGLVLGSGGLVLREDVPVVFKTNYATALLAANNLTGCLRILGEIPADEHPAVGRLQGAVDRWQGSLTFWERISWYTGGQPDRPVVLDFPPGDLE